MAKKVKIKTSETPALAWYYYYAMTGPGHQSSHDGFRLDTPEGMAVWAECYVEEYHSNIVLDFWPATPTQQYINDEIKRLKDKIKSVKTVVTTLAKYEGSPVPVCSIPFFDQELANALKGKIDGSVLQNLHKAGLPITSDQLRRMRRDYSQFGESSKSLSFTPENRVAALRAIKKARSYHKG